MLATRLSIFGACPALPLPDVRLYLQRYGVDTLYGLTISAPFSFQQAVVVLKIFTIGFLH